MAVGDAATAQVAVTADQDVVRAAEVTAVLIKRCRTVLTAVLAGFGELNPQIARDVSQTALAGPPGPHQGTFKVPTLPSAADAAAWAVLGPCGNRR